MGVEPHRWGPIVWASLHLMAMAEPTKMPFRKERIQFYKDYIQSLIKLISCPICASHLQEAYNATPIPESIQTKKEFFYWTIDLHNYINKQLHKPEWEYEIAYHYWEEIGYGNLSFTI